MQRYDLIKSDAIKRIFRQVKTGIFNLIVSDIAFITNITLKKSNFRKNKFNIKLISMDVDPEPDTVKLDEKPPLSIVST